MTKDEDVATPNTLIFDTGPLWEYIVYSAVNRRAFTSLSGELRDVKNRAEFERLEYFISRFPARTTTPNVVTEISRRILRTKRAERERKAIWETVYRVFADLDMREELVMLATMPLELVGRLGAADVSLIQLGKTLVKTRRKILTVDGPFVSECFNAGLQAVVLSNLMAVEDPITYTD